ncbi:diguanylate cyclase [Myxosarcina sp. GI1]|uniref:diguanylate cyclase n=1 Tax=Myxosarcina sp. GI1 TaxID=1541065 RepID=UPI0005653F0E|nr:diguanylate cyclase [Myxosarcina sp. GI1]
MLKSFYLLLTEQYIPHGHCYLWQKSLVLLHSISDGLTAIAYFSIASFIIYLLNKRKDTPFKNAFVLLGALIVACGVCHLIDIITLWYPFYWFAGVTKAITSGIALYTTFYLFSIIPKALTLPSLEQLENLNQQLRERITECEAAEIEIRQLNSELKRRVKQRTTTLNILNRANEDLQKSTKFNEKITNLTPNLLYIFDLESNHYIYSNRFIEKFLSYASSKNQNLDRSLLIKVLHHSDTELIEQHHEKLMNLENDDCLEIEYRIKDKQGVWHWLHSKDTIFERQADGTPKQILGLIQDVTKIKKNQLELEALNIQLKQKIQALKSSNLERIKLAKVNEFLLACSTLNEVKKALADLLKPLFPNINGAVYLVNNSKTIVEAIATWGTIDSELNFSTQECWGLRRSDTHQCETQFPGICCNHVRIDARSCRYSMCIPMMAQGETLGLLYLDWNNSDNLTRASLGDRETRSFSDRDSKVAVTIPPDESISLIQELGETVAPNIAMSLANIKLQETLRYQSFRDPLTGLYNRRYLEESLTKEIERAQRKQHYIGIMILDVDYFKRFNDTYGHDAGDLVLRAVSQYLREQTRQYDLACRYGGEELVTIMPEASLENTIVRAEGIREGIKNLELIYEGKHLEKVTVSIGISCFPDDGIESHALLRAADKAMYQAKQQGRDRVARC